MGAGGGQMIYWNSLSDFLQMGGHGPFVWGSFAVTALVFAIEIRQIRRQRRLTESSIRDESYATEKN
jgi:heme exporter protein D